MKLVIGVLLALTIVIAGFGQAVHYLWNWLMPALFGLPVVTFWQAVGLLALSWVLFGGWRGFRGPAARRDRWTMAGWNKMTPEEREKFREAVRNRCGEGFAAGPAKP